MGLQVACLRCMVGDVGGSRLGVVRFRVLGFEGLGLQGSQEHFRLD